MRTLVALLIPAVASPLFVLSALQWGHDPAASAAQRELIHRNGGYVGAAACASCHPDHHASWRATHHSRMTQRAEPANIAGAFDGQTVRYEGEQARPFRDGDRFLIDVPTTSREGGGRRIAEVAFCVGSRRYQQYFERQARADSVAYVRLPILWHIEQQRWLHINTVFLGPDNPDWHANTATWNENCIFCHNTGPVPGARRSAARLGAQAEFDSAVAELGISCESCHGPGEHHVSQLRDPASRYAHYFGGSSDPAIVNPQKLDQQRSVAVCGQCHGARLPNPPERVAEWFTTGPTYRPGDDLQQHVKPIRRDTPVRANADPELFALRFWHDGTPRLTAYELQGVTSSPCFAKGTMTCNSCHAMHAGDPKGQLRPDLLESTPHGQNGLCTQCHQDIARDVAAHTHHRPDGSGSSCVECHMPKIVFGVLEIHRSHRIENPDPARDAAAGRPHACTLCHTDQTLPWAAQAMQRFWGDKYRVPTARRDAAPMALPDAIASLHAGDAAVRAVYAAAIGRDSAAPAASATAAQRAHLAVAMGDGYPSIRWLAQRSLLQLEARAPIGLGELLLLVDSMASAEPRRDAVFGALAAIARYGSGKLQPPVSGALLGADLRIDLAAVIRLTDLQGRNLISIGE